MSWNVAEAKAKFSELVTKSSEGPQVIKNRGKDVAVVLSLADFERLSGAPRKGHDERNDQVTRTPLVTRVPMSSAGTGSFRVEED